VLKVQVCVEFVPGCFVGYELVCLATKWYQKGCAPTICLVCKDLLTNTEMFEELLASDHNIYTGSRVPTIHPNDEPRE